MKFELDTDKIIDNIVSEVLERKIDGKTLKQWLEEIKKYRWISVKDRLPERNGVYLAYDGEYISTVEYEKGRHDSEWTDDYEGYLDLLVTHWMPLPEPPKE